MRIFKVNAIQAHPVPNRVRPARGPFPDELFEEPEIVDDYFPELDEDGSEIALGATAQNNYKPVKYYRCKVCDERVSEYELGDHECEE